MFKCCSFECCGFSYPLAFRARYAPICPPFSVAITTDWMTIQIDAVPSSGPLFKGQSTQTEFSVIDCLSLWQMIANLPFVSFTLVLFLEIPNCLFGSIQTMCFTFVFLPSSSCVVTHAKGKSSLCSWHLFSVKLHRQVCYWGMSRLLKHPYRAFSWQCIHWWSYCRKRKHLLFQNSRPFCRLNCSHDMQMIRRCRFWKLTISTKQHKSYY